MLMRTSMGATAVGDYMEIEDAYIYRKMAYKGGCVP